MSYVDESIYETKRQSVTLTEDNYDAYPETILFDINLNLGIDLKIESKAMSGDTLIWGHPTRGKWGSYKWNNAGSVGFILGHSRYGVLGTSKLGTSASSWTTEEELVNV